MTFEEFKILAKGMKAVYSNPNFLPDAESIKIWYQLLKDLDYKITNLAVQKYMQSNKFPPTPADIREQATSIIAKDMSEDWGQAWEQVCKAISRYGMWDEEIAEKTFSENTKKTVKRLGWKQLCMSETPMQDRANFRMIFEEIKNKEKQNAILAIDLKKSIQLLQNDQKQLPKN